MTYKRFIHNIAHLGWLMAGLPLIMDELSTNGTGTKLIVGLIYVVIGFLVANEVSYAG